MRKPSGLGVIVEKSSFVITLTVSSKSSSLMDARGVEECKSWEKRLSNSFIAAWLVLLLCGVWLGDRAEALVLLEREVERAARGVLVGGETVARVEVAGTETVERASSIILRLLNLPNGLDAAVLTRICPHR